MVRKKKYLSAVNTIKLEKSSLIHITITERVNLWKAQLSALIQPRPSVTLDRIGNNKPVAHDLCHPISISICAQLSPYFLI